MRNIIGAFALALALNAPVAQAEKAPLLPVKAFAQLPQVSDIKLSPNGDYIAMMRSINGRNHVLVQHRTNKKDYIVIPPMDEMELRWFDWINDDRLIFSVGFHSYRDFIPTLETRLFSIDKSGKDIESMARDKAYGGGASRHDVSARNVQIQDTVINLLPDDPDHFLLSIDFDRDAREEVRKVKVKDGRFSDVTREREGIQNWLSDQQGRVRYGWGVDTRDITSVATSQNTIDLLLNSDGFEVELKDPNFFKSHEALDFAAEPNTLYTASFNDKGRRILTAFNTDTQKISAILFEKDGDDFSHLLYAPFSGVPVGAVGSHDDSEPIYFDDDYARLATTINKALPDTKNAIINSTRSGDMIIVFASNAKDAGYYYIYDDKAKALYGLLETYPDLFPEDMADVKSTSFKARDGLDIPTILTLPRGIEAKNLPTIILPHGGPQARDTLDFNYTAQFLANRGYAVIQPNFRGSTGYGQAFEEAGYQQWGLAMQDDVTDATKWAINQGLADPARICIVGASYGGYAALMGAVKESDLYKCAASINGISDVGQYLHRSRFYIGGNSATRHINRADLDKVSPKDQAHRIKADVLLIAAEDDRTVLIEQTEDIAQALKKNDKAYDFIKLESGGHGLDTEQARTTALTALEAFLKANIGN